MTLSADAEEAMTKKVLLLLLLIGTFHPAWAFRRQEEQCKLLACALYYILLMYIYLLI